MGTTIVYGRIKLKHWNGTNFWVLQSSIASSHQSPQTGAAALPSRLRIQGNHRKGMKIETKKHQFIMPGIRKQKTKPYKLS